MKRFTALLLALCMVMGLAAAVAEIRPGKVHAPRMEPFRRPEPRPGRMAEHPVRRIQRRSSRMGHYL